MTNFRRRVISIRWPSHRSGRRPSETRNEFRAAVERVEQRLKANDAAGAAAALQDVERLNPSDPALEGLRKRLADLRSNADLSMPTRILDATRRSARYSTPRTANQRQRRTQVAAVRPDAIPW